VTSGQALWGILHRLITVADTQTFSAVKDALRTVVDALLNPARELLPPAGQDDGAGRPDEKADDSRKNVAKIPRNPHVCKLARAIRNPRNKKRSKIDLAREIMENDETKAQSIVRKLRDYRHLLE
jgi:hypothetical protein